MKYPDIAYCPRCHPLRQAVKDYPEISYLPQTVLDRLYPGPSEVAKTFPGIYKVSPQGAAQLYDIVENLGAAKASSLRTMLGFLEGYSRLALEGKAFSDKEVNKLFSVVSQPWENLPAFAAGVGAGNYPLSLLPQFSESTRELIRTAIESPSRENKVIAIDAFAHEVHDRGSALPFTLLEMPSSGKSIDMLEEYQLADIGDAVSDILDDLAEGRGANLRYKSKAERRAKEPWQMTKTEYSSQIKSIQEEAIKEWERKGQRGWPPETRMSLLDALTLQAKAGLEPEIVYGEKVPVDPHKSYVAIAIKEGKPVPAEVLKDYPDLARALPKAYPSISYQPRTETAELLLSPPRTLTMEEFRSIWEPQGWKLLIIGPTATWRQDWGEWEAIRDLVQNALDETEAYTWGRDKKGFWIEDKGKGIAVADFLLGPPKLKPPHARGRFGEGMKIAALTLLRKGYSVRVDTIDKTVWLVFLEVQVNGSVDQLAALWRANGHSAGTRINIIGYTGDDFADRFAVNIPKRDILHEGPSLLNEPIRRFNQLIARPRGRIYARDIYMRDIGSPFSYNLWSFDMAPDRHGPADEPDVWKDIGRLWATVSDVALLESFIAMVKVPSEEAEEGNNVAMGYWDMGHEPQSEKAYLDLMAANAASWQKAWQTSSGENAIIRTSDRWDGTVKHLGYQPVSIAYGVMQAFAKVIKTDEQIVKESQEALREVKIIPDNTLTARQLAHLSLARRIAAFFGYPNIEGVHAAIIPPASERVRTAGMYDRVTKEIFIASDQLERGRETVDTVIHEIAHHTSGAEDGEEAHNAAMTYVAARVVQNTAAGHLDAVMKGVVW